jgi:uncharacterized protein
MLGELNKEQIFHVLHDQVVGRIGCYADEQIYIVPITYIFEGSYIYFHSKNGKKLNMMRKNPSVCFQVDKIDNLTNWRSILIWGEFEEIMGEVNQQLALKKIYDRLTPFNLGESVMPLSGKLEEAPYLKRRFKPQAFRIKLLEMTGRYEKG